MATQSDKTLGLSPGMVGFILNRYFEKGSIDVVLLQEKKSSESGAQYRYRLAVYDTLIRIYKFVPKSAAIVSSIIRDRFFLGTSNRFQNEIDDLIKDMISVLTGVSTKSEPSSVDRSLVEVPKKE